MNSKNPVMVYTGGGPRAPAGEAHLWVCSGKNIGRRFAIDKPDMVIGRSSSADIPVVDERVSQQHALVETRDEFHVVRDLGSTNGTFVNNQRVPEAVLRDGDLIQVGETVFEYLSYQSRNLTITLRGTNKDNDAVPAALRNEARQMLENARVSGEHDVVGYDTPQSSGGTQDVPAMDPSGTGRNPVHSYMPPLQRPARDIGPQHIGHGHHPGAYPMVAPDTHPQPPMPYPNAMAPYGAPYPPQGMAPSPHLALSVAPVEERAGMVVTEDEDEEGGGFSIEFVMARLAVAKDIFGPAWKYIVLLMLVGIGLGVYMFEKNPPTQTAEFEIALHARTAKNPLSPYSGRLQRFFVAAEAAFKTPALIEKTLIELGHDNPTPELLNSTSAKLDLVSLGPPTPDTYTGTYKDRDGDWALNFLETHVRLYLEGEVEKGLRVLKAEAGFLQEQVGEMEKQLRRTEAEVMEFKKKHIGETPDEAGYGRLMNLRTDESRAIMNLAKARKTRRMLQQRLRTEQPLVKTRLRFENHYQADIKAVELKLLAEQANGKGPDHPEIIKLEKRLSELRAKADAAKDDPTSFETARNPVYTSIQNEERQLQVQEQLAEQQLAFVRQELAKVENIVATLPELEAEQAELMRSYKTIKDQYEKLLSQLQVVQVQLNLERASAAAKYEVITEPHIVYMPRGKKRIAYGIVGMVLGMIVGVMTALLVWLIRTGRLAALIAFISSKTSGGTSEAAESTTALATTDADGEIGPPAPPPA